MRQADRQEATAMAMAAAAWSGGVGDRQEAIGALNE
jgi:hypothetical protein